MSTLLYNPDRKSKDQLISEFVVRTQVYDEIMHDLETSKMKFPEQHYLLVGQRGAGKTTLLNRLRYGIQDSKKLQDKLIPVIFNEEQYNISELANLWESVGQFLDDYEGFDGIYDEIEKNIGKRNFEELCYDVLEKYLRKYNKRIVLLIDNVGDLLKKLDKTEVHRLREVLQTKKEIRLIAGSPFYLETILDYQQPLFEFFKVIRLDRLNEKETQSLLLKLGELNNEKDKIEKIINETPERIETLRTLTGGVPRTIALMYRIFTDYNDESTVRDLERILDAVTPLYKHRMDDLPIQQQKIVDAVAKNWDAISVKELKDKVRIDSKNISAQLRQLEKNQVIEKKETETKNHLYFLKERFFNIWYLMRYGRKDDKQRVVWLVRFLESWCSEGDLRDRILNYVNRIRTSELDANSLQLYATVYSAFNNLSPDIKHVLKKNIPKSISTNIIISDADILSVMKKYQEEGKWEDVIDIAYDIEKFDYKSKAMIFEAGQNLLAKDPKGPVFTNVLQLTNQLQEDKHTQVPQVVFELLKSISQFLIQRLAFAQEADDIFKYVKMYIDFLTDEDLNEKSVERVILQETFCLILAFDFYNLMEKIFVEVVTPNIRDVFKPLYFALYKLKDGEQSKEFLKAGPEIKETIDDIIKKVNKYKTMIPS
ncbi:MAG TPA: AAA family ATPase [Segetibacter sp.]|jgi:GTPase SAR1 family protein